MAFEEQIILSRDIFIRQYKYTDQSHAHVRKLGHGDENCGISGAKQKGKYATSFPDR